MASDLIRTGKLATLEAALPALRERAMAEAGELGVMAVLRAAFVHFPQPDRDDQDWKLFWEGYVAICGGLSYASLSAGMQAWLANPESQFLPKPGELRQYASQTPTDEHRVLSKARAILEAAEAETQAQRIAADLAARKTTAETQAQAIRRMLAETQAALTAGAKQNAEARAGRGIPHANRCRRPQGEINATQRAILARCGIVDPE